MKKLMDLIIMYHEVHRLSRLGFKAAKIGRELVMDRRTVKKYLVMSEEQYIEFVERKTSRCKLLDDYEGFVKKRLEDCPEASSAQIHDWLKEHHDGFIDISEKTVFNYVIHIRRKHGIPKPFNCRECSQVEELPYGKQAQVDFGEYNITTEDDKRKKVYFMSMVLSRSRQKYVRFLDHKFTTMDVIRAHEECFRYFSGVPEQIVYDQDTLLVVSENHGDLIYTKEFRQYVDFMGFKTYICRKSDPQTKGKIENVIKYIKYNFLRGRIYSGVQYLNGQALEWLERTANAKVHASTRKVPRLEWAIERSHLRRSASEYDCLPEFVRYNVRQDNTILYKSNFYQLPARTYKGPGTNALVRVTGNDIFIHDINQERLVAHKVFRGNGKLVTSNNMKRDYSSKIDELIQELSSQFPDPALARNFFQCIRQNNPRYIRDQLQLIKKLIGTHGIPNVNKAMELCGENAIYKATDMRDIVKQISLENENHTDNSHADIEIKTLDKSSFRIIPKKSSIQTYNKLLN